MHPYAHCSFAKIQKQPKVHQWMNGQRCGMCVYDFVCVCVCVHAYTNTNIYIYHKNTHIHMYHNEILLSHKKKKALDL